MEPSKFLKNYRIRLKYDGSPYEPDRNGPEMRYDAVDERTAEPVSVMLVPAESIVPAEREGFEEHMSAAQKLHHANIAKILDFGRDGDDYVYVSEKLGGETLASWVRSHGPMPADAALRVAEQIVSVLSSAGFHKLPYPAIQPSDVVLVPGQTAEGTWPLVKVTNFGLPALVGRPELQPNESDVPDTATAAPSLQNQQFALPTTDVRAEIYSLGVTLYFLFSGVALSTGALNHGPKFSGFPKPLRVLLGKLLHRDPDQRPKDLLIVTEMIREALGKIERRRALSDRYGIPLSTNAPRPRQVRTRRLVAPLAVAGLVLLLAAAIAPMLFPYAIGKLVRDIHKPKQVGVLVGVPDSSPAASQPRALTQVPPNTSASPPAVASSQPVNPVAPPAAPPPATAATTPNPFHVSPADVQQAQMANAQQQPNVAANPTENITPSTPDAADSSANANSSAQTNAEPSPTTASQSGSQIREKSVASKSKRTRSSRSTASGYSQQGRVHSMRSRVTGITSDGRLILRLPSGRTAIVAPDEGRSVPRHRNRVYMDRDQMFGPSPGFNPDYDFPGD